MSNTVRTIRLEGELGEKFGEIWKLNVSTPVEAVRAIDSQRKGFRKHFLDTHDAGMGYDIIIGDQGIKQVEEIGYPAPMRDDFTFIPIPTGSKQQRSGGFYFVLGALLFWASGGFSALGGMGGATGGTFASQFGATGAMATAGGSAGSYFFAMAGAALMATGVSMMLSPSIKNDPGNEEQSYLFDGPINTAKQGTPVPLLYGRLIVGGATISASVSSDASARYTSNKRRRDSTARGVVNVGDTSGPAGGLSGLGNPGSGGLTRVTAGHRINQ